MSAWDGARVSVEMARQVRRAYMASVDETILGSATGPCSSVTCKRIVTISPVYLCELVNETPTSRTTLPVECTGGRVVHACAPSLINCSALKHGRRLDRARFRVVESLYWCPDHARMHACTSDCSMGEQTNLGRICCVLSGNLLSEDAQHSFGSEVADNSVEYESMSRSLEEVRTQTRAKRRRGATSTTTGEKMILASTSNVDGNVATVDYDYPSFDTFGDTEDENTFATGIGEMLAKLYASAYHAVHRLIFSPERASIEHEREVKVQREAQKNVEKYIKRQQAANLPIIESVCQQYVDEVYSSDPLTDMVLLPVDGKRRLTAYWALVAMELYIQTNVAASIVKATAPRKVAERCARFDSYPVDQAMVNLLDIMAASYSHSQTNAVVVRQEHLLSVFPGTQTVKKLGVPTRACTNFKKDTWAIINAAIDLADMPLNKLQTTYIETRRVLFDTHEPIVTMFLNARRARLRGEAHLT